MTKEKVLVVDHDEVVREPLVDSLRLWGYEPLEADTCREGLETFEAERPLVALMDVGLPDGSGIDLLREMKSRQPEVVGLVMTSNVQLDTTLAALRAGAYDFLRKPVNLGSLESTLGKAFETHTRRWDGVRPGITHRAKFSFDNVVGESPAMRETVNLARKVASSSASSILIQGESGTGKDLIAKTIHYASDRATHPYFAINCAALPANLVESELFGYEKGAFTDAKARKEGLFEQAAGGTIFLDEIGELELSLQAKLLRVLDDGAFRRVGGLKDLALDSRVIAASNRDLRGEAEASRFRLDLYYRLSVIQIDVPPLRARGDDVILLAQRFIERYEVAARRHCTLSPEAEYALKAYSWPGNVRELRNVVERALILEDGPVITTRYLPTTTPAPKPGAAQDELRMPGSGLSLDAIESALIRRAMEQTAGNQTRAAKLLGISRYQLRYRLKKIAGTV